MPLDLSYMRIRCLVFVKSKNFLSWKGKNISGEHLLPSWVGLKVAEMCCLLEESIFPLQHHGEARTAWADQDESTPRYGKTIYPCSASSYSKHNILYTHLLGALSWVQRWALRWTVVIALWDVHSSLIACAHPPGVLFLPQGTSSVCLTLSKSTRHRNRRQAWRSFLWEEVKWAGLTQTRGKKHQESTTASKPS